MSTLIYAQFRLELERRVSADSVVTIGNVEYEVDTRFARQRIQLRCSPGMENVHVAGPDGTLLAVRFLNMQENVSIKRQKIRFSAGGNEQMDKTVMEAKGEIEAEFYDDESSEETLRYCVEQDLEDAGFNVINVSVKQ